MGPRPWQTARERGPGLVIPGQDASLRVDRRLRQITAAFYLLAASVGLGIANSPFGQGYDRWMLNRLAPIAAISILAIWFFPWQRYPRGVFVAINVVALGLNALLIHFTGGWESPFGGFAYFVTVFAALYYRRGVAVLVGLLAAAVTAAPLLSGAPPPEGWVALGRMLAVALATHVAIILAASALKDELVRLYSESSARHAFEERLAYQAFHDTLTGLPNRAWFTAHLDDALARAATVGATVAVIFVDLDRFKVVNDSLGHARGDQLLISVADRLRACPGVGHGLARLGGDEFTVLLTGVTETEVWRTAEAILLALEPPIGLAGRELVVTASVGIALGGRHSAADLLRDADMAMYRVKARGRAGIALFDERMSAAATARLEREVDLRRALANGEFVLHYQPKIDLVTSELRGVEALVRWQHPRDGLLAPGQFIALVEETGLMPLLGRWVLAEAAREARHWLARWPERPPIILSVNLSAQQFRDPHLAATIAETLRGSDLPAAALQLEITESTVMDDIDNAVATLRQLRAQGVRLALDDFGTGYSSLSYLKRLPLDMLKIDKSFVAGLGSDTEDTAIATAVIALAHTLGMQVTAEGVETTEQARLLRGLSCELAQGFLFAPPLAVEALRAMLERGRVAVPGVPVPQQFGIPA